MRSALLNSLSRSISSSTCFSLLDKVACWPSSSREEDSRSCCSSLSAASWASRSAWRNTSEEGQQGPRHQVKSTHARVIPLALSAKATATEGGLAGVHAYGWSVRCTTASGWRTSAIGRGKTVQRCQGAPIWLLCEHFAPTRGHPQDAGGAGSEHSDRLPRESGGLTAVATGTR